MLSEVGVYLIGRHKILVTLSTSLCRRLAVHTLVTNHNIFGVIGAPNQGVILLVLNFKGRISVMCVSRFRSRAGIGFIGVTNYGEYLF